MSKRKIIIIVVIILAVIIGGYFYLQSKKPKTEIATAEVSRGDLAQTVSVTGTLYREEEADLAFKSSGWIKEILVDKGDKVKKGQRLTRLDQSTIVSDLRQAEYEIRVQKRNLANFKRRNDTYNREQEDAQRQTIKKYEEARREILIQLNDLNLYSPIDGEIIRRNFDVGEMATAGSAVLTVANGELIIESKVPESDIVKVKIGQKAAVDFDALTQEEKFEAEIYEIDPASTVVQDVVYYKIRLKLAKIDERWKSGMSANMDIQTAKKSNVLMVPSRAVKINGGKYVEILKDEKNQITEKVKVETGLEGDDGMVEITAGNLKAGDKVVTFIKTQ
ncbi:MAG: efflux RND transporter periplasmic adaptor subunit [Candidatus Moranbacteria bacterium]|nr:efflux RND transporter periplasmic adaptor subunit [Candidatus Moranbacteria bacterium]